MDITDFIFRIAHIAAASVAVGAAAFQYGALHPALAALDETQRAALRARIVERWRPVVLALVAILLISGLVNFALFKIAAVKDSPYKGLYHALFGLKFLAALLVFHPATMLVMPGPKGDACRARSTWWLSYMLVLFAVIIVLGAVLRKLSS